MSAKAPYPAKDVAKWIVAVIDGEAGDIITHLKLQKLLYYVQAWSLALRDKPLFLEDFKAFTHGPAEETVFKIYQNAGWDALVASESVPKFAEEDVEFMREVVEVYNEFSAKQLERMTHSESPWQEARKGLAPEARPSSIITKESMASYYKALYEKTGDRTKRAS